MGPPATAAAPSMGRQEARHSEPCSLHNFQHCAFFSSNQGKLKNHPVVPWLQELTFQNQGLVWDSGWGKQGLHIDAEIILDEFSILYLSLQGSASSITFPIFQTVTFYNTSSETSSM